jgi:hypothetical protein
MPFFMKQWGKPNLRGTRKLRCIKYGVRKIKKINQLLKDGMTLAQACEEVNNAKNRIL